MTVPVTLAEVMLLDVNGKPVGCCRVPRNPGLPAIIIWSNRYFRLIHVNNQYVETSHYFVPLEDMYAVGALPHGEPRKDKAK